MHLDHESHPKASEVAAAGCRQYVFADRAEQALLHQLRGVAVDGAEGEGLERVSFGHEAPDAALELGVAVPVQHGSMRTVLPVQRGERRTVRLARAPPRKQRERGTVGSQVARRL